jgi:hypothetical protein
MKPFGDAAKARLDEHSVRNHSKNAACWLAPAAVFLALT